MNDKKNILFYGPYNSRARDIESVMLKLQSQGHKIYFLSQYAGNDIIPFLKNYNIDTTSSYYKGQSFWRQLFYLVKFCYSKKIDIIFSHLEPANYVASLAQYFIKAKVILSRHHVDEIHLLGVQKSFSYKFIYNIAGQRFMVVSQRAKDFMVKNEHVNPSKIDVINLGYDFKLFDKPSISNVKDIKETYKTDLLLLTACRLTKDKRPELAVQLVKELLSNNIDCKLLILGKGEMEEELNTQIIENNLSENCFLLGHKRNIMDYIEACNFLIHPSILDSSSVIVKEAGLLSKAVIICKDVGDFDDYLINETDALMVDKNNFVSESLQALLNHHTNPNLYSQLGKNLNKKVTQLFDINNVIISYDKYTSK